MTVGPWGTPRQGSHRISPPEIPVAPPRGPHGIAAEGPLTLGTSQCHPSGTSRCHLFCCPLSCPTAPTPSTPSVPCFVVPLVPVRLHHHGGCPQCPPAPTHLPHEEDEEGEEQEPGQDPQHHPPHRHSPLAPRAGAHHAGLSLQRDRGVTPLPPLPVPVSPQPRQPYLSLAAGQEPGLDAVGHGRGVEPRL